MYVPGAGWFYVGAVEGGVNGTLYLQNLSTITSNNATPGTVMAIGTQVFAPVMPFVSGDVNNRTVDLTYSGYGWPLPALITAISGSVITVQPAALNTPPTSGAVSLTSGGPFLINVTLNGLAFTGNPALTTNDEYDLLNGNDNNRTIWIATNVALNGSQTITFDFGSIQGINVAKMITEITLLIDPYTQGTWCVEASNDNFTTVVTLNSSFTMLSTGTTLVIPLAPSGGWTQGFRYYRLRGLSGEATGALVLVSNQFQD